MLYHWYELQPCSTLSSTLSRDPDHISTPALDFDSTAAREQARGGGVRILDWDMAVSADNDSRPDATAARLRETGLGVVGERRHRASPADYQLAPHIFRVFRRTAAALSLVMLNALSFVSQGRRRYDPNPSHTMVSNGQDNLGVATDDAPRQLFRSSGA